MSAAFMFTRFLCLCVTFALCPPEPWLRCPLATDTWDPNLLGVGESFGVAIADTDGVTAFTIESETRLNSVRALSRRPAWRYILPTAERSSGENGVQSGARRRVAAVNS